MSANNNEITGEGISFGENGFISYSHDESTGTGTLTLKNATINYTGNSQALITSNTVDKLIIELRGNNIIQTTQNVNAISGNLTLKSNYTVIEFTSTTQDGSLLLENKATNASTAVISSTVTINDDSYKNGLEPRIIYFTTMSSLTYATKAVIAIPYGISIAGVEVTSANNTNILDDANKTVSFTPAEGTTPATLTLKGAEINYESGNVIVSTLTTPLKINLIGNSNINSGSHLPFEGATGNLVFNTSGQDPASLLMDSKATGFSPTSFYTGFNNVSYEGDLYAYLSENNVVIEPATSYGLTIAGVEVTSANLNTETGAITGLDNVTFTPATNTLKLNNAVISGSIYTTLESLIIDITNTNSIATSGSKNGIVSTTNIGTLTFTGTGSLEISSDCSVIRGFTAIEGLNLETKTPYEIYNDGYYRLKDKVAVDTTGVKWLKVIQDTTYPLWIAGTQVTENNASHVLGNDNGTISFDGTSTLTLNYASIDYSGTDANPIISSIENLNVKLIGVNEIKIKSLDYYGFKYTGTNGTITFVDPKDYSEIGQLSVYKEGSQITYDNLCSGYNIYNFEQFENGGTNEYFVPENSGWVKINTTSYAKVRYEEVYDLWIGGSRISSNNRNGSGYQEYNPEKHSIVFSEASSSSRIVSNLPELIIELSGNNSLTVTDTTDPAISFTSSDKTPTGKLKFTVGDNSSAVNSMVIDCANGAIVGFSEVITDEPLKLSFPDTWDASTTKVVISDEVFYDLWVMGQQVTSANASDIFGAAQSSQTVPAIFDAEESTLTLNGLQLSNSTTYPTCIESGLESLTVTLSGDNKFQKGGDVTTLYGFKAQDGKTCNITFTTNNSGSLSIATDEDNAVVGFNKVTYNNGLAPYMWSSKFIIAPVTLQKPAFIGTYDDEDTGKLLSVSIDCHATSTIDGNSETVNILAYDVVYTVDGGSETAYSDSEPITISGPCTLTAKTIVGNTSSDVATGKYFGAKKDAFTMAIGESLADLDWCTPTFNAETEYIICKFISESNVFNYDVDNSSEAISAKATGTGTVNVELSYNDAMVTQILNGEKPITFTINVGEGLSSVFEGSNDYGGLYNDSDTPYALPEGTTAYLITGISEDGTSVATQDIGYLPARTAVLLQRGEGAKAITKIPYEGSATVPTNNKFYYSDPNSPATAPTTRSWYVIYNNKFMKVTGGTKVNGGKCYLDLGTTAGTRGFYNIGGGEGTTSLREVISEGVNSKKWADGEWYTLQGQRVAKPAKGLYILNGKKVVVK